MAKKKTQSARVPRAAEPRMYGDGKPSQQATATPAAGTASAPRTSQPATRQAGMTRTAAPPVDYSYVMKDLRRLGITAVGMFALLIVLGFIIK
jgi:hypothetical protein